MLELLLCSLLTILPDYLYRRYGQGKRLGKEITLYSVWFELRWGITACLMLTIGLITVIFYNHPSTTNATLFYRTVPIVPETNGRVAEIYVGISDEVRQGAPIFRLDSSKQEAAIETARRKIAEVEAAMVVARSDVVEAEGKIVEAKELIPAGGGRTGDQAGDPTAQPRHRGRARHRAGSQVTSRRARAGSLPPPRRRTAPRREISHASAGREGERRSRAWPRPRSISTRPSSAPA